MLVHTCLNFILFLGIFVPVANAINSEETNEFSIDQNATQINNQTCPIRVKGHLVNIVDEHFNDVRLKIYTWKCLTFDFWLLLGQTPNRS